MNKSELDTPFVVVDLDKVDANIADMQTIADRQGIALRPHAKTHKLPELAHKQVAAGAIGVTVAKLGEAEVMADAGIEDILVAYPIIGDQKIERLRRLARRAKITVALDSLEAARAISRLLSVDSSASVGVVVEMDCGFGRVGVPAGSGVLELAEKIAGLPGLNFRGLLTFAGQSYDAANEEEVKRVAAHERKEAGHMADLLRARGLPVDMISVGSTPTSRLGDGAYGVTELRPGTYIFGDLTQVGLGAHALDRCALTVKTTIVSRPSAERAVIDAGSKCFTMDGANSPIGTGRGYVLGHPEITVSWFTEEHGMLLLPPDSQHLSVGDTLDIIPNHCCAVINMVDEVAAVRGELVEAIWTVAGRGKLR